jgi:hypothetical protein
VSFVNVSIDVDPTSILDTGIDAINTTLTGNGFPGWTAADGDLAVILLGAVAQIAADVAVIASTALPAIFRAFGTILFGIPYQAGAAASVVSTWTFTTAAPSGGYTILTTAAVLVGGYVFAPQTATTTATGATTATITLVSSATGTLYNGLGGVSVPAQLNDQIDFVSSIVTTGLSSGGQDQETDDDYQNKLVSLLTTVAVPAAVTATDYSTLVLSDYAENATGVAVGRATAIDGYYPLGRVLSTGGAGSTVLSGTTTNTQPYVTVASPVAGQVPQIGATVTGTGIPGGTTVAASPAPTPNVFYLSANATASGTVSITVGAMSGYGPAPLTCTATFSNASTSVTLVTAPFPNAIPDIGAYVYGPGVAVGTTVAASPAPTTTTFALSQNSTAGETGQTFTIGSWTYVGRAVTTFVTDSSGNALTTASMDTEQTWLGTKRKVNDLPFVQPPSYNTIYVTAEVHVLPGYTPATVVANAQAAVLAYLNPAAWGNPGAGTTGASSWLNSGAGFNVVRYNDITAALKVQGVQYVPPGSAGCAIGTTPSPSGTTDITMTGPAPLPRSTSMTILVTSA